MDGVRVAGRCSDWIGGEDRSAGDGSHADGNGGADYSRALLLCIAVRQEREVRIHSSNAGDALCISEFQFAAADVWRTVLVGDGDCSGAVSAGKSEGVMGAPAHVSALDQHAW